MKKEQILELNERNRLSGKAKGQLTIMLGDFQNNMCEIHPFGQPPSFNMKKSTILSDEELSSILLKGNFYITNIEMLLD